MTEIKGEWIEAGGKAISALHGSEVAWSAHRAYARAALEAVVPMVVEAERESAEALAQLLRQHRCTPDLFVGDCVDRGLCGCSNGLLIAAAIRQQGDDNG